MTIANGKTATEDGLTCYDDWDAEVPDMVYETILNTTGDLIDAAENENWDGVDGEVGMALERAIHAALAFALYVGKV